MRAASLVHCNQMKPVTRSFYETAIQRTIEQMAANLDGALDLECLARGAGLSAFHFHRVFRGMVGETPLELALRAADGAALVRLLVDAGAKAERMSVRDAERDALFERAAANGPVLAITEGLLIYLPEAAVVPLARELHDVARARWWLTDLASPKLLRMLAKGWAPGGLRDNAPFGFMRTAAR